MKYFALRDICNITIFLIDVLNELSDVLKIRNERKKANELQSESVNDDARYYGLSDLTTVTKTPIYEKTGIY